MKIYFIRHGETDWNIEGKLQGRTDIPLNENGRYVAELTRDALMDVPFEVAFTSPLTRAKNTAEIILANRNIPIIEEPRMIEIGFGIYEGRKKEEWDDNITNFFEDTKSYIPTGNSETIEEVLARVGGFLQELFASEAYKDSVVLVATHGATLRGVVNVIKKNSIEQYWEGGVHKNCGMTVVEVKDGKPEIVEEAIVVYDEAKLLKKE